MFAAANVPILLLGETGVGKEPPRPYPSPLLGPFDRSLRRSKLCRPSPRPAGGRDVRHRAGCRHRRRETGRASAAGRRRDASSRRDRRDAPGAPGEASPGAPGERGATRRRTAAGDPRSSRLLDQRRPRGPDPPRRVPSGPLLPSRWSASSRAAASGSDRGPSRPGRGFPPPPCRGRGEEAIEPDGERHRSPLRLPLAWKCPGAGQRSFAASLTSLPTAPCSMATRSLLASAPPGGEILSPWQRAPGPRSRWRPRWRESSG